MDDLAAHVAAIDWYHSSYFRAAVVTNGVTDPRPVAPPAAPSRNATRQDRPRRRRLGRLLFVRMRTPRHVHVLHRPTPTRGVARVGAPRTAFCLRGKRSGSTTSSPINSSTSWTCRPRRPTGPFDVVLFLGVAYHLTDTITALERVSSCCKQLLILETETALNWLSLTKRRACTRAPGSTTTRRTGTSTTSRR